MVTAPIWLVPSMRYTSVPNGVRRFVPIVRTFTPVVAGAAEMPYRSFVTFNVLGGFLWALGVTSLGHVLGQVAFIRANIEYAILAVIAISLVPVAIEFIRARRRRSTVAPTKGRS